MSGRSLRVGLAAIVATAGLAGCAGSTERAEVQRVAVDFVTAVEDRNGQDACDLLTSEAEESVSGATDVPCPTAVLSIEESGAEVHHVQIWGDAAQVKLGSDTVFLRRLQVGWQVRAAGCHSQPGAAYNCDVEG
ncbi:MAG TPA: hypothetical protein VF612_17915 [Jatrophihabitans sp.]|uniref:hypothetical protein n=1 Tax=Jatrophihabitans sp. TaxID=1932789 RepID=UPI002F063EC4